MRLTLSCSGLIVYSLFFAMILPQFCCQLMPCSQDDQEKTVVVKEGGAASLTLCLKSLGPFVLHKYVQVQPSSYATHGAKYLLKGYDENAKIRVNWSKDECPDETPHCVTVNVGFKNLVNAELDQTVTLTFRKLPKSNFTSENSVHVRLHLQDRKAVTTATTPAPATTAASIIRRDFDCDFNSMYIHLPVSIAPNARMVLRDPGCILVNNGTHYVLQLNNTDCGTTATIHGDRMTIENDITVYTDEDPAAKVVFTPTFTISLSCERPAQEFQSVMGQFRVMPMKKIEEIDTIPSYNFTLKEFTDSGFQQEVQDSDVEVTLSTVLYVQIRVDNSSAQIRVHRCYATPTTDANDDDQYQLIYNGCPVGKGVTIESSPSNNEFRFGFQSFYFRAQASPSKEVYLHCDVTVGPSPDCGLGGTNLRKRRSSSLPSVIDSVLMTLTSAKHIMAEA